jgi:hypothetical protein
LNSLSEYQRDMYWIGFTMGFAIGLVGSLTVVALVMIL